MYDEHNQPGGEDGLPGYVHPTYRTSDIWAAAYLHLMGVPLLRVELDDHNHHVWLFDNENDFAYQSGRDFRTATGSVAIVPILDFRNSYRKMAQLGSAARREREHEENEANGRYNNNH